NIVPQLHAIYTMLADDRIHIRVPQPHPGHLATPSTMYDGQLLLTFLKLIVQPGEHWVLANQRANTTQLSQPQLHLGRYQWERFATTQFTGLGYQGKKGHQHFTPRLRITHSTERES